MKSIIVVVIFLLSMKINANNQHIRWNKVADCLGYKTNHTLFFSNLKLWVETTKTGKPLQLIGEFIQNNLQTKQQHKIIYKGNIKQVVSGTIDPSIIQTDYLSFLVKQDGNNKLQKSNVKSLKTEIFELWEIALDPESHLYGENVSGYVAFETNTPGVEGRNLEWSVENCTYNHFVLNKIREYISQAHY